MTTLPKKKYHDPLDDFLDRPIAYNPAFKRIIGSTVGAVFFSQAWYWSKRHPEQDGWFYKTQGEWQEETGLTRYEQETARKHCGDNGVGILDEKLRGVPATLYYRVRKDVVYQKLGIQFAETPHTEIAEIPQTSLVELPQFGVKQQSGTSPNINKVTETPTMIPSKINDDEDDVKRRTKIFATLFQDNIGMLTPLLGDMIKAAVVDYPLEGWYEPAFKVAVKNNVRTLNYVTAVLKGWKDHGFGWSPKNNGAKYGNSGRNSQGASAGSGKGSGRGGETGAGDDRGLSPESQAVADRINKRRWEKRNQSAEVPAVR